MFALQAAEYRPVLAHPERYGTVQADLARAIDLAARAARGMLLQINLPSLTGLFGQPARRATEALLRAGAVHLAASDAHSPGHRYATVPEGIARLQELVGDEGVMTLLEETPRALPDGQVLPAAAEAKGAGWWERGRRRLGLGR